MVSGAPGVPGPAAQRLAGMAPLQGRGCVTARPLRMGGRSARVTRLRLKTALNDIVQVSHVVCHKIARNLPPSLCAGVGHACVRDSCVPSSGCMQHDPICSFSLP